MLEVHVEKILKLWDYLDNKSSNSNLVTDALQRRPFRWLSNTNIPGSMNPINFWLINKNVGIFSKQERYQIPEGTDCPTNLGQIIFFNTNL